MKVYIIVTVTHIGYEIHGAFSKYEDAAEERVRLLRTYTYVNNPESDTDTQTQIEEMELNSPATWE